MPPGIRQRNRRRAGVTLVELLVASVSAAILVISSSIILTVCFRTLRANSDAVELQRDVDITTRTLYRAIRTTRRTQVTTPAVGASGPQLTMDDVSCYRADASLLPAAGGSYLVYDPDTGVSGDEQVLVNNSLQSITFYNNTNSIGMDFTVAGTEDTLQVVTDIHMRNEI